MNESDAMLRKIESSLNADKKPRRTQDYSKFKLRVDALKQLDPSLFSLFRLCDEILAYIDASEHDHAVVARLEANLNTFNLKINDSLNSIDGVQSELRNQIKTQVSRRLNLMESKWDRMLENVDTVLTELTRVLKQM